MNWQNIEVQNGRKLKELRVKVLKIHFILISLGFTSLTVFAKEKDCSEFYDKPSQCKVITCSKKYQAFLGTWEGPFQAYDRGIRGFRPYHNKISYAADDCLKNLETNDEFIVGRREDNYPAYKNQPAKIEKGALITGRKNGRSDQPFLRTLSYVCEGVVGRMDDYTLVYSNNAVEASIWQLKVPAASGSPERTVLCQNGENKVIPALDPNADMIFTTLDTRDMTTSPDLHKRLVSVTLQMPGFEGAIVTGYHSKQGEK